jgi:alpha-galactosidase
VTFCSDWQGRRSDPGRQTEVRLMWTPVTLHVRFRARYREIYVYPGGNRRRDQLWLRDVAEVFVRPGSEDSRHYREFEISPNGDWLDLEISPGRTAPLMCGLRSRVVQDPKAGVWVADLAIPIDCLTRTFDPCEVWRANFFRVEGAEPNRFYSSWRPTCTPQPNFHVPEAFGELIYSPD